jgi:hypothetical protein
VRGGIFEQAIIDISDASVISVMLRVLQSNFLDED